jgi:hypothetical protein
MTRSMTISSTIDNKIEQIPIKTVQLPDIIPSPSISIQPVSKIEPINDPIISDNHVRLIHINKSLIKIFSLILENNFIN